MSYLSQELRNQLQVGNPVYARSVIRLIVKRVELLREKIAHDVLPVSELSNQLKLVLMCALTGDIADNLPILCR
jgi:hypothetical protein